MHFFCCVWLWTPPSRMWLPFKNKNYVQLPFSGCVSPFVLLCILSQEKHSLLLPRIHGPRDVLQQACSPPSNQQVAAGLPNSSWTKPMLLVFAAAVKLSSPCVPPTSPGYVLLCWSGLLCLPWM
ncbi:hypothetical protein VIGAN_05239300 [Vigna angularis var. angularis]|uniref:Uncharacterized protein n=1 Tax=Vigna angularis var. angularis TaxID=157739 RepID=A0A0S3S7G5_PHAAN|nr:hypothetical protein VIGAN_05239300 [Vigna angularis var. angularis]